MATKDHFQPMTEDTLRDMSPSDALNRLKSGNKRFLKQLDGEFEKRRKLRKFVNETSSKGQFPFAIVLSCVDSRMPTEILFDQSIGDIFNARIAGNFVNEDILGSMEFACSRTNKKGELIGSKLILVLGHTSCGAVGGAFQKVYPECFGLKEDEVEFPANLGQMLENITPAIKVTSLDMAVGKYCKGDKWKSKFVNRAAENNVALTIKNILIRSDTLRGLYNNGDIGIEGAMYDIKTGKVTFNKSLVS
ncbi:MAG: carbonic anhydrase [Chitinophagales bacterium]|nr:carbonic anhydrase [Chitinophagales bacterium]